MSEERAVEAARELLKAFPNGCWLSGKIDVGSIARGLQDMEARKDAAYLERNQVVAALASAYPSGIARTAIPGWSDDWHGCVYIDLPTGQASYHYHDSHAHLFAHLPLYAGKWDGHTTDEKYVRVAALAGGGATLDGQTGVTQASARSAAPNPAVERPQDIVELRAVLDGIENEGDLYTAAGDIVMWDDCMPEIRAALDELERLRAVERPADPRIALAWPLTIWVIYRDGEAYDYQTSRAAAYQRAAILREMTANADSKFTVREIQAEIRIPRS